MSEETNPKTPETEASEAPEAKEKPARAAKPKPEGDAKPKAKKEKPPALEDKPFPEFITEHFLPSLTETFANVGIKDLDLKFEKRPIPISGLGDSECWQVIGHWKNGQRQFIIIFSKEDISAPKFFCYADNGAKPSTLESFMIDERKVNLDLMVFYTVQRLNGQKWLVRN